MSNLSTCYTFLVFVPYSSPPPDELIPPGRGGLIENAELFLFEFDQLLLTELNDERDDGQERRAKRPRSLSRGKPTFESMRGVASNRTGFALFASTAPMSRVIPLKRRRRGRSGGFYRRLQSR